MKTFVASTFQDLKAHREHVITQLRSLGVVVDAMEDWPAAADEPKEFCPARLVGCDFGVLIVARRRGFVAEGETLSITQMEYEAAMAQGMDMLVFLLDEDSVWHTKWDQSERDPKLREWRGQLMDRHLCQQFNHEPTSIRIAQSYTLWLEHRHGPGAEAASLWRDTMDRNCESLVKLIDRSNQLHETRKFLADGRRGAGVPQVLVLQSPEEEEPDSFCEALQSHHLPALLGVSPSVVDAHRLPLPPVCVGSADIEGLTVELRGRLINAASHRSEDLAAAIALRSHCVLSFRVMTESVPWTSMVRFVSRFVDFWSEFPTVGSSRCIVILSVVYDGTRPREEERLRKWMAGLQERLARGETQAEGWSWRSITSRMLRLPEPRPTDRVCVLHPVEGVTEHETMEWLRFPEVEQFLNELRLRRDSAQRLLSDLFAGKRGRVPMRQVMSPLQTALLRHAR